MNTLLEIGLSNAAVVCLLALAAGAIGHYCRRPAVAHGLWLLVLLKLITPPLVSVPIAWPAGPEPPPAVPSPPPTPPLIAWWEAPAKAEIEAPVEEPADALIGAEPEADFLAEEALAGGLRTNPSADPPPGFHVSWQMAVLALWLAGSVGWFGLALVRIRRFHQLLRHARPAPPTLAAKAEELAERLGLAYCPGVWLVPGRVAPMLWAMGGRPRLLLPTGLVERLDTEQLATLLAHELAHLRRRDHWVRALEVVVTGLFWWHPVVWWARRELREAEEQCCDAWVVWALPDSGRDYATALVDTLDYLCEARAAVPGMASGIGQVHDLKRRLTMIMCGTTPRSLTWGGCLGLAVLGLVFLPVLPTWAQTKETQEKVEQRPQTEQAAREAKEEFRKAVIEDKERAEQVDKARAQVKEIAENIEKMRRQLQEAEAQLRKAQERLAALEGKRGEPGKRVERRMVVITIKEPDGRTRTIELPDGADVIRRIETLVPRRAEVEVKPPVLPRPPLGEGAGPGFGRGFGGAFGGPPDARLRELERKIDELLKEVESLRREMRPPRPGSGAPSPERPRRDKSEPGA
ncbi:MAG TPA: M56 family metallopeptidase [Gemmataceae bacterium]|nr:M56 family metallopeptidase [Gemmataceae bacterium]